MMTFNAIKSSDSYLAMEFDVMLTAIDLLGNLVSEHGRLSSICLTFSLTKSADRRRL